MTDDFMATVSAALAPPPPHRSNYMMFEVLETSWGTLQNSLDSALTLDDIIQAHKAYMKGILARAMLNEESTDAKNKVEEVSTDYNTCYCQPLSRGGLV